MDFEEVYTMYFKDVYLYLRSLSATEDIAEDLTQEVFSKALKSLNQFDGSKDIRAWLFTIAKNVSGGLRDSLALLDQVSILGVKDEIDKDLIEELLGKINEFFCE